MYLTDLLYTYTMQSNFYPPPIPASLALLQEVRQRDFVTARRALLLEFLWRERYLTRDGLIHRVAAILGAASFGAAAWEDTFFRDMRVVKMAFNAAGLTLRYSRRPGQVGYYLSGQAALSPEIALSLRSAAAEIDPRQSQIFCQMSVAQRFRQGFAVSAAAYQVVRRRSIQSMDDLTFPEFVKLVIDALEAAGVTYLIGGALAVWAWGEPRLTLDLDMAVMIPLDTIEQLSKELAEQQMVVPVEMILDNLIEARADTAIHVIHGVSGFKAELYPWRPGDDLRQSALARRQLVDLGDVIGSAYVHTPEDLIIYKLWYFSLSQQSKHARDILSILQARREILDLAYIETWVARLNLESLWNFLWASG
jgi:hypothetical protein